MPLSDPTPPPPDGAGPLDGVRVVELAHPFGAFACRLLADAGADVIVVEPPSGARQRSHEPFAGDEPGLERSLAWWAENTSKRSFVADMGCAEGQGRLRRLMLTADVFVECEEPGRLADLGLDYDDLRVGQPALIHAAITPFGRGASAAAPT